MAVSVDSVYKTVLLILNKEQRGFMTPDEYNRIGSQVQREIFETYFEDINQQVRVQQSEFDYANRVYNTDEKIAEFKTTSAATYDSSISRFTLPQDLYRLNTVTYEPGSNFTELPRLTRNEFFNVNKSKLTKPSKSCPVYLYEDNMLTVFPQDITGKIGISYVKKPQDIRWGYEVGTQGQYLFTDKPFNENALIPQQLPIITNTISGATAGLYNGIPASIFSGLNSDATFSLVIDATGALISASIDNGGTDTDLSTQTIYTATAPLPAPIGGVGDFTVEFSESGQMKNTTQGFIDFELHNSERSELVLKILLYAGIVIRDPQVIQTAMAQIQKEELNEKQ